MSAEGMFLGFDSKRAEVVVKRSDAKHEICKSEVLATIHVKHEPTWSDLVVRNILPSVSVSFGCRIFDAMVSGDRRSLTCIQLFHQFLDRFGLEFVSGTFTGKLLYHETVADRTKLIGWDRGQSEKGAAICRFRPNSDGSCEVYTAFVVDVSAYESAAANQNG